MSEHDYSSFSSPGSDLNHDGKVDFAEYDNDCHDFNNIYGKNSRRNRTNSSNTGGVLDWIKNIGSTELILMGLFSLMFPTLLIVAIIIVIIGLFLNL